MGIKGGESENLADKGFWALLTIIVMLKPDNKKEASEKQLSDLR